MCGWWIITKMREDLWSNQKPLFTTIVARRFLHNLGITQSNSLYMLDSYARLWDKQSETRVVASGQYHEHLRFWNQSDQVINYHFSIADKCAKKAWEFSNSYVGTIRTFILFNSPLPTGCQTIDLYLFSKLKNIKSWIQIYWKLIRFAIETPSSTKYINSLDIWTLP